MNQKVIWTAVFAVLSALCAGAAAQNVMVGLSVFFGLWAVAGIFETAEIRAT